MKNLKLHVLRCAVTGLYLADATADFVVVAVSQKKGRALRLDGEESARDACRFIKALYPTFDWKPEPEGEPIERHAMIHQSPAEHRYVCSR